MMGRPSSPSRRRHLRKDELALWRAVTRHVTPFAGRDLAAPEPEASPVQPAAQDLSPPPPPPATLKKATVRAPELKLQTSLQVKNVAPQARIDLHGMRQVEAHAALSRFLRIAHAKGHRTVLVITGKGDGEGEFWWEGRGVLRRNLPHWLDTPEMKALVLGYQEASRQHGGAGAYYVQLRKPRGAGVR